MVRLEIDSTMSNRRGSPSGDAQPWPPSGLSGPSVGDHWPTMEPSVKPFSVSLIRREPRSSEARWRKADWNGEAENRSEATLRRQAVPRPAASSTVPPRPKHRQMPPVIWPPGRAVHRTAPTSIRVFSYIKKALCRSTALFLCSIISGSWRKCFPSAVRRGHRLLPDW